MEGHTGPSVFSGCFMQLSDLQAPHLILVYSTTLTLMWGAIITRVPNPFALMSFFHVFLTFALVLNIVAGIFALLAAIALLGGSGSSRILALVASFFALINGPLGIALGAFTLVVFVPRGSAT